MLRIVPAPAAGRPEAEALKGAVWVDLIDPTPEEVGMVAAALGLRAPTREAVSEIESSSRLQLDGQVLRLSTPLLADAGTPEQALTSVGFVVAPNVLMTVRFADHPVFDAVAARLDETAEPVGGVGAFILLLEALVDRGADLLEHLAGELEAVSQEIFSERTARRARRPGDSTLRTTLIAVGRIGDRLSEIRAALLGIGRIAPFVREVGGEMIGGDHDVRLAAVGHDVASLTDFEDNLANKTQFLLDAVLGFINTQQNELFKILTIVSVVGVPPTLVASIYGMNFRMMPELEWAWGYPFALVLIVASAAAPILWFKWKRWW